MSDNVQKIPFGRSFQEGARRKVLEHIQLMSGRAPATLMKATDKTNTIWMVKFDTDSTYTMPMITVPVHGSEFQRVPYQQGAKGFVGASDFETGNMTGLRSTKSPVDFTRPGNLSSMVWHPLGNANFKPAIDPNAHETYGADGGTITHDGTAKSLVKTHADNGTSVSSGGDGSGAPGPHAMTTHPENGTAIATTAAHLLTAMNATLNKQGDQTNQGDSTSSGNISTPSGNISAPGGMVSGMSGSFASGFLGALKLVGGILSGGGGSSGSPSLMISSDEVSAATLRTNVVYTVAGLNAQLPPSAGMRGVRALVSDATATPAPPTNDGSQPIASTTVQYGSVLQGGGSLDCGAICLMQPGGSTYQWCAG